VRIAAAWNGYFYQPTAPAALGAFRVVFYLTALLHSLYHFRLGYFDYPEFLFEPAGVFLAFPLPQPDRAMVSTLYYLLWVALALSIAGTGRSPRVLAAVLALYIYGVRYSYGFHFKAETGVCLCLLVMAIACCDDALAWRKTPSPERLRSNAGAGLYSWPLQFVRTYWVFLIFTAGLFKLLRTGWDWAEGDAIHQVLVRQMYYFYPHAHPPTPLGSFLLQHKNLTLLGSWFSLLVELAAPSILFGGRFRLFLLANFIVMLTLVRFTMSHSFVLAHMPLYLALLPWESIGPWVQNLKLSPRHSKLSPRHRIASVDADDFPVESGPAQDQHLDDARDLVGADQPS
jgi:hypothetical protein